jgi:hypothetical protein
MGTVTALQPASPALTPKDIDRCAFLIEKERAGKPERDELADLKAKFQLECASKPSDKPVRLMGTPGKGAGGSTYFLDLSAREMKREITDKSKAFAALKRILGLDELIERLTITFKLLESVVPEEKRSGYIKSERTGSRDISAGLLQTPTAA